MCDKIALMSKQAFVSFGGDLAPTVYEREAWSLADDNCKYVALSATG